MTLPIHPAAAAACAAVALIFLVVFFTRHLQFGRTRFALIAAAALVAWAMLIASIVVTNKQKLAAQVTADECHTQSGQLQVVSTITGYVTLCVLPDGTSRELHTPPASES